MNEKDPIHFLIFNLCISLLANYKPIRNLASGMFRQSLSSSADTSSACLLFDDTR